MQSEDKRKEWSNLVKEFEASNQSKKEWCSARKISPHVFGYWFSIFSTDSQNKNKVDETLYKVKSDVSPALTNKKVKIDTSNWLEIQLPQEENKTDIFIKKSIEIKIGKAEISVSAGFDKDLFKEVVKILGEI